VCPNRFATGAAIAWSVGGLSGSFADATAASTTFTPTSTGNGTINVTVTAASSGQTANDSTPVSISCAAPTATADVEKQNGAPYPAGAEIDVLDQLIMAAQPIDQCLTDTSSIDLTWSVFARPPGSTAALSSTTDPTPSFAPDVAGTYQLQLVVTDALGLVSAPAYLSLTALGGPNLSGSVVGDASSFTLGRPMGITITVANGTQALVGTATLVTASGTLPSSTGTWTVDQQPTQGSGCSISGITTKSYFCSLGNIPPARSVSFHLSNSSAGGSACPASIGVPLAIGASNSAPKTAGAGFTIYCPPIATSLIASSNSISLGGTVLLTPTFANGTGVITNDQNNTSVIVTSGHAIVVVPGTTTTFTLTVTNPAGATATTFTTIVVS
jgi:hypothetical protein